MLHNLNDSKNVNNEVPKVTCLSNSLDSLFIKQTIKNPNKGIKKIGNRVFMIHYISSYLIL